MSTARVRERWTHTASIMALLANCHRDPPRSELFKPADFDPYAEPEVPVRAPISILKDVFLRR